MTEPSHSDEYRLIWMIRRVFRAMGQKAEGYLQDLGLSAADRAVMEFIYPGEALSVPEIASRYRVSRQHVQVTVNRLIDQNLLKTSNNPRHRRSPLIALTERGRALFGRVRERERKIIGDLFANVAAEDLRGALRTLERLRSQLAEENSHA